MHKRESVVALEHVYAEKRRLNKEKTSDSLLAQRAESEAYKQPIVSATDNTTALILAL